MIYLFCKSENECGEEEDDLRRCLPDALSSLLQYSSCSWEPRRTLNTVSNLGRRPGFGFLEREHQDMHFLHIWSYLTEPLTKGYVPRKKDIDSSNECVHRYKCVCMGVSVCVYLCVRVSIALVWISACQEVVS